MGESKSRSLNFTLEELLGINNTEERPRSGSSGRPQTRHGRDSATPESRKTSPYAEESRSSTGDSEKGSISEKQKNSDDDFMNRISDARRRSILGTKITQPTPVPEVDEHDVENEEAAKNGKNKDTIKGTTNGTLLPTNGRPGTSDSSRTFEIDDATKGVNEKGRLNSVTKESHESSSDGASTSSKPPPAATNTFVRPPGKPAFQSTLLKSTPAHQRWLEKKLEEGKEKKRKEREREEKKKEEEKERRKEAQKMFEKWKANFEQQLREKKLKERAKRKADEQKKKEEEAMKKKEAENLFNAWKRERTRSQSAISRKKMEKDAEWKKRKTEEQIQKRKEAEAAFEVWKAAKEEVEQIKRERSEIRAIAQREKEAEESEYKQLLADEAYETWLQLKEEEQDMERAIHSHNSQNGEQEMWIPPWIPPSNTVPRSFTPTGKRRMTLDAPRSRAASAGRVRPNQNLINNSIMRRTGSAKSMRLIKGF